MGFQLGLDTGGTYTDAVLVDDEQRVVSSAKSLTTHANLVEGLQSAVDRIVDADVASGIELVSLSTTLATNALVEGRGRPVALILVGFTPGQMQRANLQQALAGDPVIFLQGGHDASGHAVAALDTTSLRSFVEEIDDRVEAYAVSSMFAVRNPSHENEVQTLIASMTGKPLSCGHQLTSGLDAPRRALTALLNARLIPMIEALLQATRAMLQQRGIRAPLMVVKGDGSLISDAMALSRPVETILSGPAASVVGARFLCREENLLVSDMGGTTTDIALIRDGRPRLNPEGAIVGGWRTMVQAIDVQTHGLGGDSGIWYNREQRQFDLQTQRVLPLSLLVHQRPELEEVLEAQLRLPFSTTHSAQFVLAHGPQVNLTGLSAQQRELHERIVEKPIAVQSLFSDQTMERALSRLEQRGLVLRAGFTPSDAAHVLGRQTDWNRHAACLGAQLLMRYAKDNHGPIYGDEDAFCTALAGKVSSATALMLLDAAAASQKGGRALSESQKTLLQAGFAESDGQLLRVRASVNLPVVALGAPARSYYPATAELLDTRLVVCEHAQVANALGAVVGSVRQEQHILLTPAGGERVQILLSSGPEVHETLEEAAVAAARICSQLAAEKLQQAGGAEFIITVERHDNMVTRDGQRTFLESRISAVAVGRPAGLA
ncbi:hydantoinase/oxoprolinase N-terminal domain-containing protein [Granulosicoccus sp. 3-233]|uniref:hydantoinase/oxoprolinase N-terminal domain-containing protein n=1 Tax=Granulosicoccus sp. 3-233 TaxID=3417969 RepID=UPI003D354FA8